MKRFITGSIMIFTAALLLSACGKEEVELIPREALFGNPDKAALRISPDGKYLSYLAPVDGVLNVWVTDADNPDDASAVSKDTVRGIRQYFWSYATDRLLYLQDEGGDENWMLHCVDVSTGEDVNLTPFEVILDDEGNPIMLPSGEKMRPTVRVEEVSVDYPEEILIGLNNRDPRYHDLYRLNILTGDMEMVLQNDEFAGFITDDAFNVRFAVRNTPDGGKQYLRSDGEAGWSVFMTIGMDDMLNTSIIGFRKNSDIMYMIDSRDRNTGALVQVDLESGEREVLAQNTKADVSKVMRDPETHEIQAVAAEYERVSWQILDDAIRGDIGYLRKLVDGDFAVTARTLDDRRWTVAYVTDDGPLQYYVYDRETKDARFLFTNRAVLEQYTLSNMTPVVIPSRDGLDLVSYLTIPKHTDEDGNARPAVPLPMVLLVHGGPWGRDSWGYNSLHQWLSNRGYAVLSVNFRGSTGFGKDFINAGNLEWAGKMHDDLLDAVDWATDEGIARPDRIAIMGGSYGGYATLVGMTFTPDVFTCGVDIVGPSNLNTLLSSIPPYWTTMLDSFASRVGDPRTEEGKALLEERSPLQYVDQITRPLLIAQGANDPRVKQAESDQIVDAMQNNDIPVTYVLYPDEGHGFARPENSLSFYAVTEQFLAKHLGGRSEPIGDDFQGASITVPEGAGLVPGLNEALQ